MSEIILITPGSRTNTMRMPLGLMYLSACLDRDGITNEILDIKGDPDANGTNARIIGQKKPKYVGITVVSTEVFEVRDMCADIRKVSPTTKIILGGPGPSYRPDHYITAKVQADYMVLGEADHTLGEFIHCMNNGGNISEVDGAYHMSDPMLENRVVKRALVENIAELPYPAYDSVNMDYYCKPSVWAVRFVYMASLSIMTSRGCPYTCKFCVVPNIYGRSIRLRTPEQSVTQIEYLIDKFQIDGLFWLDEVFTGNKKWCLAVCKLIKERNVNIRWGCQTRAHLVDPDLMKTMKDAGCMQIDTGYESGSDRMLDVIDKGVKATSKIYLDFAKSMHSAKLRHLGNFMINLPEERMEDVEMSIDFIKKAKPNVVLIGPYIPVPGTSFGTPKHDMRLEDMDQYGEERAEAAVLEERYKFAEYDDKLVDVLHRMRKMFPYPSDPNYTLNPVYWYRWCQYFSYLFTWRYWKMIWKSKRRHQYFDVMQMLRQKIGR